MNTLQTTSTFVYKQDAHERFKKAIKDGRLSNDQKAENFAGNYMYMGTSTDSKGIETDTFKHCDTRQYLK